MELIPETTTTIPSPSPTTTASLSPSMPSGAAAPVTRDDESSSSAVSPPALQSRLSDDAAKKRQQESPERDASITDGTSANVSQVSVGKTIKMTTSAGVQKGLKFGSRVGKNIGKFSAKVVAKVGSDFSMMKKEQASAGQETTSRTSTEFFMRSFAVIQEQQRHGRWSPASAQKHTQRSNTRAISEISTSDTDMSSTIDRNKKSGDDEDHQFGDDDDDHYSITDWYGPTFLKFGFDSNVILTDGVIMWVVVISIVLDQLSRHYDQILTDHKCNIGVVLALSLLSFVLGLEMNEVEILESLKSYFIPLNADPHTSYQQHTFDSKTLSSEERNTTTQQSRRSSLLERIFKRGSVYISPIKSPHRTVLRVQKSVLRKQNNDLRQSPIMIQLQRFGQRNLAMIDLKRHTSKGGVSDASGETGESADVSPSPSSAQSAESTNIETDFSIGSGRGPDSIATDLIAHVSQPLCEFRGRDLFRSEEADPEMINHPFLLRNGLRDCPTFMMNFTTIFGNICIYFKLPDWVQDFEESLVENEDDFPSITALKRFLRGDDEYRKKALKVMPELVDGPTAVRLLAPRNRAFPLELNPLISTSFQQEPTTDNECPILAVNVDFVTNSTMRGFVGIFKRNMHRLQVDFACIIDPGDGEPSAVIGLWRMDKLLFDDQPELPDRYATTGTPAEDADTIRASILVENCELPFKVDPVA